MAKFVLGLLVLLILPAAYAAVPYNTSSWSRDWETANAGSDLSISVPNIKVPITLVSFRVEKATANASLTVQLPEHPGEAPYDVAEFVELVQSNLDSAKNIKARFRLEKALLGTATPGEVKLYHAPQWIQIDLTLTSQDNKYEFYVADLPEFGLYAFVTQAQPTHIETPVETPPAKSEVQEIKQAVPPAPAAPDVPEQKPVEAAIPEAPPEAPSKLMSILLHPIALVLGGLIVLIIIINILYHFMHKEEEVEREEHAETDEHMMKLKPLHERQAMERQKWPYIDKRKGDRRTKGDKDFPLQNLVEDVEQEKK